VKTNNIGFLFGAITYGIDVHPTKKSLIDEYVATQKIWTQIFRRKPTIMPDEGVGLLLEEEHVVIPDPDLVLEMTIWKVLFEERVGWIQYYEPNIKIFPQK
jgi:hypothetical protein